MTHEQQAQHDELVEERLSTLFDGFGRLKETDLLLLRRYWDDIDPEARKSAWAAAEEVISDKHREPLLEAARHRIATWVNDYESAYFQGPIGGSDGFPAASVREAAIPPLMDAVVATIASDTLGGDVTSFLYGPLSRLYDEMRAWIEDRRRESSQ